MRDKFTARIEKRSAVDAADAAGDVSDSMSVRTALIERMNMGELTLAQVQAELKTVKREGKRIGKPTRAQVWNRS